MTRRSGGRPGISAADRRFEARARLARRRRLGRVMGAMAAAATVAGAVGVVGWSDVLAASEVRVEGAEEPLASAVVEAAAVPLGEPLVRLDVEGVAARVSDLPDVAEVVVERSWPSAVTLEVTPRVAVAVVPDDDVWWQVDATGAVFGEGPDRPDGLPVLVAGVSDDDDAARAAAVAVIADLPADVAELVEEVRASSAADVRLALADDVVVRWGTADDTARKADVLLALMADQDEPPDEYDVSAPEAPSIRR